MTWIETELLVCAATSRELATFDPLNEGGWDEVACAAFNSGVAGSVTGVGIPLTLLRLPSLLRELKPKLVLNIGIAGAYPNSGLRIGDVVMARSEIFGDIGFELPDEPSFQHVSSVSFGAYYAKAPLFLAPTFRYEPVGYRFAEIDACTVNACTGTKLTGLMRERVFGVAMESMEGAAVALACSAAGIPVCEVRAISNMASDRDMRPENIAIALQNLTDYLAACRRREGI